LANEKDEKMRQIESERNKINNAEEEIRKSVEQAKNINGHLRSSREKERSVGLSINE